MADAKAIVDKLYQAFNDPGFLGLGGTDEESALEALKMAKDQGIMKDVDALYAKTYPDEPNLKDEIDDELGGDDFDAAIKLYDEGMKAETKSKSGDTAAEKAGAGGGTGKTQEPQLRVSGTLTPSLGTKNVSLKLSDFDFKPYSSKACKVETSDGSRILFEAETNVDGLLQGTVPASASRLKITVAPKAGEGGAAVVFEIRMVDKIPPIETAKGALLRLHNLGYYEKEPGDAWSDDELMALWWFQLDLGLPKRDTLDGEARMALAKLHGC
ncbi:MAG: hypothetical protein ABI036_04775 [Fibrobacteria bacterium]